MIYLLLLSCHRYRAVLQYKDNLEQRMKYADQPEKFMDSEVDLDEQVKSLLQVNGCSAGQVTVTKLLYREAAAAGPLVA